MLVVRENLEQRDILMVECKACIVKLILVVWSTMSMMNWDNGVEHRSIYAAKIDGQQEIGECVLIACLDTGHHRFSTHV